MRLRPVPRPTLSSSRACEPRESTRPLVAIVGAGFSGTMAAIHLRRALGPGIDIALFDRSGRFARGPAYASGAAPHLLNVRARNMSAFHDAPNHFDDWLRDQPDADAEVARTDAGHFATRRLYGRYLRQLLYREMRDGNVLLAAAEITGITRDADRWCLTGGDGRRVHAEAVVLANGNLAGGDAPDGPVFHNAWSDAATADLRPDAPVLVIGTGLTMVDLALEMRRRGFAGPILAISRRGLVPHAHVAVAGTWPPLTLAADERASVARLIRRVRLEVARAAEAGVDWRVVIDGVRPVTAALWRSLPTSEQARFLRHGRPFWDIHRHRMAPPVADAFARLLRSGALAVRRGRARAMTPLHDHVRVTLDLRGETVTRDFQRVVHATGIRTPKDGDALVGALCAHGLARLDPHSLGLRADECLRVLDADGIPAPSMWALGPIIRGMTWESTAVPDIRAQAGLIARDIAARMKSPQMKSHTSRPYD